MKWIALFLACCANLCGAYIGYIKTGGRFGDNVLNYLHAKWLSYKHDIPLLYEPFLFSDQLVLSDQEVRHSSLRALRIGASTRFERDLPLVYQCPYFPAFEEEQITGRWWAFEVDWKDPQFRKIALAAIQPKHPVPVVTPPEDAVSIAVHIREGGGFDTDHTRLFDPLKLPPILFYREALAKMVTLFPGKAIYCHLFTDAIDTASIYNALAHGLAPNVQLEIRKMDNHHTKNVLEDFYSLFLFDVLIRPRSNFSIVPDLLHDYAVVCYPAESVRTGTTIDITRIGVEINQLLYQKLTQ